MWVIFSLTAAFFAGVTSVLVKIGVRHTNSNLVTALRTIVVVIFAWLMVFITNSTTNISQLTLPSLTFLILSGGATGCSWLCYFKALQIGDINKVAVVDKSSTILTMIWAILLLGEKITLFKFFTMCVIAIGTYCMINIAPSEKPSKSPDKGNNWLIFALLSAFFASITAILSKVGMAEIDSTFATAIRTLVVLVIAWIIVLAQGTHQEIKSIDNKSWLFIILSGFATGASWLCYYRALKEGPASIVVPLDKLSILVTVAFGYLIFKERLQQKSLIGLALIIIGTLCLLL